MRVLTAHNQMDNQQNLEKVSIENLEKEKLRAEIDILNARLETEYPDKNPGDKDNRGRRGEDNAE